MADDLQAIRGIGPKTAENIAPWLTFEECFHHEAHEEHEENKYERAEK